MAITNKQGLPDELAASIAKWRYKPTNLAPDYYRVTELLQPAQLVTLQRRHGDKVDVDVADLVNAFKGTAIHELLSQYQDKDVIAEARIEGVIQGRTVVGKPDYYSQDGTLADFKSCKVWKYVHNDFTDWIEQVNIYRWMLEKIGFEVKRQGIVAIFDDWSRMKAKDSGYPPAVAMWIPIIRMEAKDVERMMQDKIAKLERAWKCSDDKLPECSEDEMWADPTLYKVKKQGTKNAYRNFESKTEAEKLAKEMVKKNGVYYSVVEYPGVRKRCEFYCPVSQFCVQYKTFKSVEVIDDEPDGAEGTDAEV